MSANLYDLLDVDESASAAEIRAAWKSAIADLDPTDRRFRAYNDAAGVLLDDDKRASYDAGLASERAEVEAADDEAATEPEGDGEATTAGVAEEPSTAAPEPTPTAPAATAVEVGEAPVDASSSDEPDADPSPSEGPRRGTLIAVGVAATVAVVLAITVFLLPGVRADRSPKETAAQGATQARAALEAESAAEQLVAPVLSYNHKTMAEDLDRLTGFLTDAMAAKQTAAWPELTKEAVAQQIVVEATATATALTRVDPDGKRATVVVFIDQNVEKKSTAPFVLRMWATMSLVREDADGRWLLDDLCTDDSCG